MSDEHLEKAIEASMNGTTETLSPCLRLLIEILLNETVTKKSRDSAVKDIDLGQREGWRRAVSNPLSHDLYRLRGCDSSRKIKQVESETKVAAHQTPKFCMACFPEHNIFHSKRNAALKDKFNAT